jgi:hypothetical protein
LFFFLNSIYTIKKEEEKKTEKEMEDSFPWCIFLAVFITMLIGFIVMRFISMKQTKIYALLRYIDTLEETLDRQDDEIASLKTKEVKP